MSNSFGTRRVLLTLVDVGRVSFLSDLLPPLLLAVYGCCCGLLCGFGALCRFSGGFGGGGGGSFASGRSRFGCH